MEKEGIRQHLESGEWLVGEADKLIKQYVECKTAHERFLLLPKIEHLSCRMSFESKEIKKLQKL